MKEEEELRKCVAEDIKTLEEATKLLKDEYSAAKASGETYEDAVTEFQNKIKAIIGDDLTN
jgi:phage shock protein A